MPRYQDEIISFDVPRDWEDRTIVVFAAPSRPGLSRTSNVVMTREPLRESEGLGAYADRQLAQLSESLDGFELLGREERRVAERAAVTMRIHAGPANARFEQHLTLLELPGRVIATLTMTVPVDDAPQMAPLYDRILSTVRLATRGAGGMP
jgi:hypothetical protein